jgi:hypothetical protein
VKSAAGVRSDSKADVVDVVDRGEHSASDGRLEAAFVDVVDTRKLGGLKRGYADVGITAPGVIQ